MSSDRKLDTQKPTAWPLGQGLSANAMRRLNEIEGNPFDAADEALFAFFDAQSMSAEERIAYLNRVRSGKPPSFAVE
ncbi:MAG: hypothetical protein AAF714_00380 [Pseudomonadota bacterium]